MRSASHRVELRAPAHEKESAPEISDAGRMTAHGTRPIIFLVDLVCQKL